LLYAIISDIHANLEAAETCFREIDKIKPDRIICLGDIVDYCAQPKEVMEIIRARCDVIIMGNHDEAQIDYSVADSFSESARISSIHTRFVLNRENKDFIRSLNYTHIENDLLFVHSSPFDPGSYRYILDDISASMNFRTFSQKVCFIGHSHVPVVFRQNFFGVKTVKPEKVKEGGRYIINTGSVGQPRDGDPRLSFGVFDSDNFEFRLVRTEYDIKSAAQKIINEGLPVRLAERLFKGI